MRVRTLVAVTAAGMAAALLVVGGAAATSSPAPASAVSSPILQLRTLAAARAYLVSLGIDARSVVIQRGVRNYAGPKCPGRRWNCTTATRVLQLGTTNTVACIPGSSTNGAASQTCTIVQSGSNNNAACTEKATSATMAQDCKITQTGARNVAGVAQTVVVTSGATQTATQTVEVTQSSTGASGNLLGVLQSASQSVAGGTAQVQDAHQELTVHQTASGAGMNTDGAAQLQSQTATGGMTQSQNTNASGLTPCPAAGLFGVGNDPNACAYIEQNSAAGNNVNGLNQTINETETSGVATSQLQGSSEGGIGSQEELTSTSGASKNAVRQSKTQTAKGPTGVSQTQTDPMFCCGISANGNSQSSETLSQFATQSASSPSALQTLTVIGFVHAPNASCSITQTVDGTTHSTSSSNCTDGVGFETTCTNGVCTTTSFTPTPVITVDITGSGSGTVSVNPEVVLDPDCTTADAPCSFQFPAGTTLTLTATADSGSFFNGWSGGGCSGTGDCTVTLNANTPVTTVTADFEPAATLTVQNVANALSSGGTVTSDPAGIDCVNSVGGSTVTCTHQFPVGTAVTLTATPASGSVFESWSGAGCTGSTVATCSFTLNADTPVTAVFNPAHTLTVTASSTTAASGTVTSNPSGISCSWNGSVTSGTCKNQFPAGMDVTLTETPGTNVVFGGWTGDCTSTATTCTLPMTKNENVNADFEPQIF